MEQVSCKLVNEKFTGIKTAEIVGIITNITYPTSKGSPTFYKIFFPNSKKTYNGRCDFFCPLRVNDTIYGFCSIGPDETLHLNRLPFVQPAIDKDSIIQCLMKILKLGYKVIIKLYYFLVKVADGEEKVVGFLSSIAQMWNDSQNVDILNMFDEEPENIKKLLKFWYKDRNLRRLYLFGLTKTEIKTCKKACDEIYQICIENPYTLPQIPIEKCDAIMDMLNKKPEHNQRIKGAIVRVIWKNLNDNGWMGTPTKMLIKMFPDIKEHVQILKDKYGIVAELETAYLSIPNMIEKYMAEYIINKKLEDNINYDTPLDETITSSNGVDFIRKSAHFTRDLSEDQKIAIQGALDHSISIITGGAGTGKCLDPNTKIVMYNGDVKKVKFINKYDEIMGPDSKVRIVQSVCTGTDNMYEIIPLKGKGFICNEPHVLTLKCVDKYITDRNNNGLYTANYTLMGNRMRRNFSDKLDAIKFIENVEDDIYDIALYDYMTLTDKIKSKLYLYHVGVEYDLQALPVDSYIVGYWMGDENTDNYRNDINNTYKILIENVKQCGKTQLSNRCYKLTYDEMIKGLSSLNILKNKNIPKIYKINTFKNRVKLITGFIDVNGYNKYDDYIIINIKQKQLADDIEFIINSLGYMSNNNKVNGYYELIIYGDKFEFINNYMGCENKERINNKFSNVRFDVKILGRGKYCGFELDGDGRFLLSNFMVTHNTTCLGQLIHNLNLRGVGYAVTSFTGKAVSRIREVTKNKQAATLHRLIANAKKLDKENLFTHLIIDEASMITTELLYNFIQVYPTIEKITLVGDVNQLPPISWGDLFHQVIKSETIPTYKLTTNYRVYTGSGERDGIILNANLLISHDAQYPFEYVQTTNFSIIEGGSDSVYAIINGCYASGIKVDQIVILTPYNRTIEALNKKFQEIYNKDAIYIIDSRMIKWCLNDRVMLIENDQDIEVFNGESGIITDIKDKSIMVNFSGNEGENRTHEFMLEESLCFKSRYDDDDEYVNKERTVKKLTHANAITIDKSQGSEWDFVILYLPEFNKGSFLNKNRIYTAITRTKRCCWVVTCDIDCFNIVSVKNQPYRCDNLGKRLKQKLPNLQPFKIEAPIQDLEMKGDLPTIPDEYTDNGVDCDDFD